MNWIRFDSITNYAIPVFDHGHEYVPAHVYNVCVCVRVRASEPRSYNRFASEPALA